MLRSGSVCKAQQRFHQGSKTRHIKDSLVSVAFFLHQRDSNIWSVEGHRQVSVSCLPSLGSGPNLQSFLPLVVQEEVKAQLLAENWPRKREAYPWTFVSLTELMTKLKSHFFLQGHHLCQKAKRVLSNTWNQQGCHIWQEVTGESVTVVIYATI